MHRLEPRNSYHEPPKHFNISSTRLCYKHWRGHIIPKRFRCDWWYQCLIRGQLHRAHIKWPGFQIYEQLGVWLHVPEEHSQSNDRWY